MASCRSALGLNLPDDTHAQIKQRADVTGVSVHSWIIAAIDHENFRQLCQETNEWWAQHPDASQQQLADHHQREEGRASAQADRGSSAA
ncbi:MAG: ribbon-helix-helix protein, CopG family [Pseudonocardiaceae bacterium]